MTLYSCSGLLQMWCPVAFRKESMENTAVKIQLITFSSLDFWWVQLYSLNFSTYTWFYWRERGSSVRSNLEAHRCSCISERCSEAVVQFMCFLSELVCCFRKGNTAFSWSVIWDVVKGFRDKLGAIAPVRKRASRYFWALNFSLPLGWFSSRECSIFRALAVIHFDT